jgi:hypothetical protein
MGRAICGVQAVVIWGTLHYTRHPWGTPDGVTTLDYPKSTVLSRHTSTIGRPSINTLLSSTIDISEKYH